MPMSEEARERRAIAMREAAKARSDATEKAQLAEIEKVWEHIPDEPRRVFDYIRRQIPRRTPEDVTFLRETRALWFRPYRQFLDPKEEVTHVEAE